jgi:hypothetical protein
MESQTQSSVLKRWSLFLYAAGLWNIGVATQALVPDLHARLFLRGRTTLDDPVAMFYMQLALGVVGLFGVGYIVVGLNPLENRAIIGLGIAGKVFAFLSLVGVWWREIASDSALVLGFGDLLWAVGFSFFLARTRDARQVRVAGL